MATGSWQDIPIDDSVFYLGRWAVQEYNGKQHTHLEYKGIWTGKMQQVERGRMFWLTLEAVEGGESNSYEAKVLVTPTNHAELEEFKPLLKA